MKSIRFLFAFLAVSLLTSFSHADEILFATGDSKTGSAYSRMFRELLKACPDPDFKERESLKGSAENLDLMANNEVQGAALQGDFLTYWNKRSPERVANIRTLVTLHQEELHYIARADVKKEGGFMGIGGKKLTWDTLNDLRGRSVGAVGGSFITANVVSDMSGLGYTVQQFPDTTALKEALTKKQIDSILIVGGAQHPIVAGLPADFKLLPIPEDIREKLSKIYRPVELNYSNLNAVGVKSLATPAYLTVYNYDDPDVVKKLMAFRACFTEQAPKLANRPGTFAKWRQVNVKDEGGWAYYSPNSKSSTGK